MYVAKDGITDWGDPWFDFQYTGASLILYDGHVMGHHFYTNSDSDAKRALFKLVVNYPSFLRVIGNTFSKFGQFFSGMLIRWVSILFEKHNA